MRLELLPQHVERATTAASAARDPLKAPSMTPGSEGVRFQRLKLAVLARGDRAIVIVPERPDVDWAVALPTPASAPEASRDRPRGRVGEVQRDRAVPGAIDVAQSPATQEVDAPLAGPRVRVAPTLGEAMLMVDRVGPRSRTADETPLRTIVVLVPRVPRTFTLLGD